MIGDLLDDELSDVADLISLNTGSGRTGKQASEPQVAREREERRPLSVRNGGESGGSPLEDGCSKSRWPHLGEG